MTFQDLQDIISFAKANNLMHKTFLEVYNLWTKRLQEKINEILIEEDLMSLEIDQ